MEFQEKLESIFPRLKERKQRKEREKRCSEWNDYISRTLDVEEKLYGPLTEREVINPEDFEKVKRYGPCKVELNVVFETIDSGFGEWKQAKATLENGNKVLQFLESKINGDMRIPLQGSSPIEEIPFRISYGKEIDGVRYTKLEIDGGRPLAVIGSYIGFIRPS